MLHFECQIIVSLQKLTFPSLGQCKINLTEYSLGGSSVGTLYWTCIILGDILLLWGIIWTVSGLKIVC